MKLKTVLFLGLAATSAWSCKTDETGNDDPLFGMETSPYIVAPYKRLMKEVEMVNGVVVNEKTYNYSDKKLTSISTTDNSFSESISYTGDLINKIVKKENSIGNIITTTSNFVYNSADVVTKLDLTQSINDGTTVTNYVGTTDFVYTNAKLTKATTNFKKLSNGIFTPTLSIVTEWTYQNGDVIESTKTTHDYIANLTGTVTTTLSNYDSKKSLYNALPFQYNFYSQVNEGLSTHNPRVVTDPSGTTNYSYGYDADSPLSRSNGNRTTQFQYTVF